MKTLTILVADDFFDMDKHYRPSLELGFKAYLGKKFDLQLFFYSTPHRTIEKIQQGHQNIDLVVTDLNFAGHHHHSDDRSGNSIIAEAKKFNIPTAGMSNEPEKFENADLVFKKPLEFDKFFSGIVKLLSS